MTDTDRKVAVITGGSQGIGAGLVAGRPRRWFGTIFTSRT